MDTREMNKKIILDAVEKLPAGVKMYSEKFGELVWKSGYCFLNYTKDASGTRITVYDGDECPYTYSAEKFAEMYATALWYGFGIEEELRKEKRMEVEYNLSLL